MNRINTFQIPLGVDHLRPPIFAGAVPTPLAEPMQALLTAASRRSAEAPFTMYLCADDDTTRVRDDFAIALARTLTATIPSTLVVDCDFLHPGLNGQVPQRDALGFLDYLLYGSSIGVITQDENGVHIVGPGSFPVTKRMPFVDTAFTDAARRLVAHARVVIFVGPLFDGGGGRHPIATAVDVVTTVRTTPRHPRVDSAEEHIANAGIEVWSVRLGDAAVADVPPAPAPQAPRRTQPEAPRRTQPEPPRPAPAPEPPAQPPVPPRTRPAPPPLADDVLAAPERSSSSLAPRIAVIVIGLLVAAFAGWWYMNRDTADIAGIEDTNEATIATRDTTSQRGMTEPAVRDTAATRAPATETETTPEVVPPPREPAVTPTRQEPPATQEPPQTTGAGGGTELVSADDIQVMEDLNRKYRGWFMIHISSFQTSARAREETAFLQSREFPVFIVFLDLGPKGKWYRVYAGPFETRDEARDVKKNLDAIPQVRFTRIASIPD
jgi:cell division septation protein DedD